MKIIIAILSLSIVLPTLAGRSVVMKGKLESYNTTHFKLKQGKKSWNLPLSSMEEVDQIDIAKKIGKEITVNAPLHLVKQGK